MKVYIAEIGAEEARLLANPLYRPKKPDAKYTSVNIASQYYISKFRVETTL